HRFLDARRLLELRECSRELVLGKPGALAQVEGGRSVVDADEREHQRTIPNSVSNPRPNPAIERKAERRPRTPRANRAHRSTAKTPHARTGKTSLKPHVQSRSCSSWL